MRTQRLILGLGAIILLLASPLALAQLPGIVSQPLANGGQNWSLPVQTLVSSPL